MLSIWICAMKSPQRKILAKVIRIILTTKYYQNFLKFFRKIFNQLIFKLLDF